MQNYRQLDEAHILTTLSQLRDRISERFGGSGLSHVAEELLVLGKETAAFVDYLRRPNWTIRIAVGVVIAAIAAVLLAVVSSEHMPVGIDGLGTFFQATEAFINILIFLGAALYFLVSLENRLKRKKTLEALYQLRSMAHIVDMHQLTKDPERISSPQPDTASSPVRVLSAPQLGRYLDYCSELLAVISKIAALHVQHFSDPIALATVNEIETLCGGLSGKIWQKITLLDRPAMR